MAGSPRRPVLDFVRRTPALALLVSLGALILVAPIIGPVDVRGRSGLPEICFGALVIAVLLTAALTAARQYASRIAAWGLVTLLVIVWVMELSTGPNLVAVARHTLGIAYVLFVIVLILVNLFTTERVTVDTIAASLCVYFLLAYLWAEFYSIMEIANPGSFHVTAPGDTDVPLQLGSDGTALALYYSLVTMSTLGYGDVVPGTPPARMFAAMEAVTGQMYLAVLVARLVGMHIAHSRRPEPDNGDSDG